MAQQDKACGSLEESQEELNRQVGKEGAFSNLPQLSSRMNCRKRRRDHTTLHV